MVFVIKVFVRKSRQCVATQAEVQPKTIQTTQNDVRTCQLIFFSFDQMALAFGFDGMVQGLEGYLGAGSPTPRHGKKSTAEPAYKYIVFNRFLARVVTPFIYILLLFNHSCNHPRMGKGGERDFPLEFCVRQQYVSDGKVHTTTAITTTKTTTTTT